MEKEYTTIDKRRKLLIEEYNALSSLEKEVLQVLSIVYRPISKTELKRISAPQVNGKEWNGLIDGFLNKRLIVNERPQWIEVHPLITEMLAREAGANKIYKKYMDIYDSHHYLMRDRINNLYLYDYKEALCSLRYALYTGNTERVNDFYDICIEKIRDSSYSEHPALAVFGNPFDQQYLNGVRPDIHRSILHKIFSNSQLLGFAAPEFVNYLKSGLSGLPADTVNYMLLMNELMFTDIKDLSEISSQSDHFIACIGALKGDHARAIPLFENALKAERKLLSKKVWYFEDFSGVLFLLALVQSGEAVHLERAKVICQTVLKIRNHPCAFICQCVFQYLVKILGSNTSEIFFEKYSEAVSNTHIVNLFVYTLSWYWCNQEKISTIVPLLQTADKICATYGIKLLKGQFRALLSKYEKNTEFDVGPFSVICDGIKQKESWEYVLDALIAIAPASGRTKNPTQPDYRLVWHISNEYGSYVVRPVLQKKAKRNEWTNYREYSRPDSILKNVAYTAYLTDRDKYTLSLITDQLNSYYQDYTAEIIASLEGNPLVFMDSGDRWLNICVERASPLLIIKNEKRGMRIFMEPLPEFENNSQPVIIADKPGKLVIVQFTKDQMEMARILKKDGLLVPSAAKEKVIESIQTISPAISIHSDVETGNTDESFVKGNPALNVLMTPSGQGIKVQLVVKPAADGHYFTPGKGARFVFENNESGTLKVERDLDQEMLNVKELFAKCPSLVAGRVDEFLCEIESPDECIECISELQNVADKVIISWPQGQQIKVSRSLGWNELKMRVKKDREWFLVEGSVNIDESTVLEFRKLLDLVEKSPGKFIQIGENQFVALTEEFRRKLNDFRAIVNTSEQNARLHPLAALHLADFEEEITSDKAWKEQILSVKRALSSNPKVPHTFQAQLRDYQTDGFVWMSRLAEFGAGACLADDMGLGKTIQALVVLLSRAAKGPALVIAPTSVCNNWISEAERFATELRMQSVGSTTDRKSLIEKAGKFDVIVCSYNLFQQESEIVNSKEWHTIVLDEAQSIKNFSTKRSKAAMDLKGKFKVITTGTPVENHLMELWTLFRFLNPGLLGSVDSFKSKFANPIEGDNDKDAKKRLRRLIAPFILRRTKGQVLDELPPKTEIVIRVELSKEEIGIYESLRLKAIDTLSNVDISKGTDAVRVLAEITRLRRTCCHPRLIAPEFGNIEGSKLSVFGDMLDELIDNKHRALVFSQFVDHLTVIREYLDKRGIGYKYLDGSTPAAKRKEQVADFQEGKGDLFLISLKAGGTGLNLTGADFVFHMDPWWNPAVEDQASDRVHRIGQTRPVTIYRLIAKNTIEEKIVDLHKEKRELADSLLEGTDSSARVSAKELLRLIRENV